MDLATLLKALVMGVVEGLTEFLPVSSTGHLILAASLLDFTGERVKLFEVVIQTGAILAVLSVYAERLWGTVRGLGSDARARRFAANVAIGFVPAAAAGVAAADFIKGVLFNPIVVASGFIVGGVVILWAERRQRGGAHVRVHDVDELGWRDALNVGLVQCLALIPGTSRSGITMTAARAFGYERVDAARFSLLLSMPTIFGAGLLLGLEVYESGNASVTSDALLAAGFAFLAALVAIALMMRWLRHATFTPFVVYRVVLGVALLIYAYGGFGSS